MTWRLIEKFRKSVAAVLRDRRGATAMMFAFMVIPIFASVGLAVDSSLGYLLKSRMSKSLDTAGLAAGRLALNANAEDIAWNYFTANFNASGGSAAVTRADFEFELSEDRRFVTLSVVGDTPTLFMRIFGRDTMTVSARTRIRRETTGMELTLVMDNTGSMWDGDTKTNLAGTPFEAMQNAAIDLIGIVFGDESEIDNVWVSLVPYVATVNIGNTRTGWLNATDQAITSPGLFGTQGWKGCVMARAHPFDGDDTPPATRPFSSYRYPPTTTDNNWMATAINDDYRATNWQRRGPNLACGTPITPLTKSRATIEAGIAAMRPWRRGGTTGNLGLSWGWRTLSPQWRGLWGGETPSTHPLDYHTPLIDKVVVILTDGKNEFYDLPTGVDAQADPSPSDYTAYGRVNAPAPLGLATSNRDTGRNILDNRMAATCTAMKAQGIRIYAITFTASGSGPDPQAQNLFRNCANTPAMYHHAPNNATLRDVFRAIGGELASLRIVE